MLFLSVLSSIVYLLVSSVSVRTAKMKQYWFDSRLKGWCLSTGLWSPKRLCMRWSEVLLNLFHHKLLYFTHRSSEYKSREAIQRTWIEIVMACPRTSFKDGSQTIADSPFVKLCCNVKFTTNKPSASNKNAMWREKNALKASLSQFDTFMIFFFLNLSWTWLETVKLSWIARFERCPHTFMNGREGRLLGFGPGILF